MHRTGGYNALGPISPVRIRIARSRSIDEDLAVADLAGVGGGADRLHHLVDQTVVDGDFQLDLRQEIDHVFGAAIQFGMALLAAETP
jgi:hypothetical protein